MTRSIIRTITTAIAIVALAAPTALARPADMPPAVAKAAAAEQHKQARLAQHQRYPTRPAQGEQANPRPEPTTTAAPSAPAERDIPWTTIAIWLAALAAIAGDRQARAPQRTHPRHRITSTAPGAGHPGRRPRSSRPSRHPVVPTRPSTRPVWAPRREQHPHVGTLQANLDRAASPPSGTWDFAAAANRLARAIQAEGEGFEPSGPSPARRLSR